MIKAEQILSGSIPNASTKVFRGNHLIPQLLQDRRYLRAGGFVLMLVRSSCTKHVLIPTNSRGVS